MYCPNMIVLGDMNLDFERPQVDRPRITQRLKGINSSKLKGKKAATLNLPSPGGISTKSKNSSTTTPGGVPSMRPRGGGCYTGAGRQETRRKET